MEVLSSRVLIRPRDLDRSHRFYGETLGLAVFREFGAGDGPGIVYFAGGGLIEVAGGSDERPSSATQLWFQVRDVDDVHRGLVEKGVTVLREPRDEPWGLREMWIADPDGIRIAIVQVPEDHPLRSRP